MTQIIKAQGAGGGGGGIKGPTESLDGGIVLFDGSDGKKVKDSGVMFEILLEDIDAKVDASELSEVAFSGEYIDIKNAPATDTLATPNTLVERDANGRSSISTPTTDTEITNKKYVDDADKVLDDKIKEIQLFKFPNAVIIGEPTINNGQVSGFTANDYMQFPFILDLHDKGFQIDFSFTTGNDVITQQNILDSKFGLALAIKDGKGLMAISTNGTSWAVSTVGNVSIQPNTTYYARLSWNRLQYKTQLSTDGTTYTDDMVAVNPTRPFPATTFIGGCSGDTIGHTPHPFGGTINMNKAYMYVNNQLIWQGMDDAGLATRADISLSNLDAEGEAKFDEKLNVANPSSTGLFTHEGNGAGDTSQVLKIRSNNSYLTGQSDGASSFHFGGVPVAFDTSVNIRGGIIFGTASQNIDLNSASLSNVKQITTRGANPKIAISSDFNAQQRVEDQNIVITNTNIDKGTGAGNTWSFQTYAPDVQGMQERKAGIKANGDIVAQSFIKPGGESNQFLKADGSLDSNSYATESALNLKQDKALVTTLENADDTHYPSTKAVADAIISSGGGDMLAANNLSDLTNKATARTNLDVYSKGETNTQISNYHDSSKQNTISDLVDIRNGAGLGASAVQPAELELTLEDYSTKDFVNSSINSVSAHYLTYDAAGNGFPTKASIGNTFYYAGATFTPTKNDYLVVLADETKDNATTRYVAQESGGTIVWAYQYTVNETAMTQAQLNAINSGITSSKVSTYDGYATSKYDASNPAGYITSAYHDSTKQDVISNLQDIINGANAGATAVQPGTLSSYATKQELNGKQDTLVSGTNIKTVKGTSLLGNGNIDINEVPTGGTEGQVVTKTATGYGWGDVVGGGGGVEVLTQEEYDAITPKDGIAYFIYKNALKTYDELKVLSYTDLVNELNSNPYDYYVSLSSSGNLKRNREGRYFLAEGGVYWHNVRYVGYYAQENRWFTQSTSPDAP